MPARRGLIVVNINRFSRRNVDEDFTTGCDLRCDDCSGGDCRCRRCDCAAIEHPRAEAAFEFAQCMRDNGVDDFPDPQISADGSIHIDAPAGVGHEELAAAAEACERLLPAPADQNRADQLPLPIRRGNRWCRVATASVPMAASSPSGSVGRTRPRSCCSSKEVAPVGMPKRPRSRRRIRRPTRGTRRMRIGRFAAGTSTGTNPDNPFADYSFVFVPYCTGDVHLGDVTRESRPSSPSSTTASSTAPRR